MNSQSRRVRYTLNVIREAFLQLLAERPFSQITVSQVCARADVARGTFYLHYSSLDELLNQIEEDLIAGFEEQLRIKGDNANRAEYWEAVLSSLKQQQATWATVLSVPESNVMAKAIALNRLYTKRDCEERYPHYSPEMISYLQTFLEQGSGHVITQWLQNGCKTKIKPLAALLAQPF